MESFRKLDMSLKMGTAVSCIGTVLHLEKSKVRNCPLSDPEQQSKDDIDGSRLRTTKGFVAAVKRDLPQPCNNSQFASGEGYQRI